MHHLPTCFGTQLSLLHQVAWDLLELRHLHLYLRGLQDVSVPRKNKDYMLAEVFAIR